MSELQHANSFRDLVVHQKARKVAQTIFQLSKGFPREEAYSLTDQIRRAARSVGAQIAEAWGKRQYERHFVSKLTDADAEQLEAQHWTDVAFDCGYLTQDQQASVLDNLSEIGRMLSSMIAKASQFCGLLITDD
jgi:four helix bundle protein